MTVIIQLNCCAAFCLVERMKINSCFDYVYVKHCAFSQYRLLCCFNLTLKCTYLYCALDFGKCLSVLSNLINLVSVIKVL